jgi:Sec-independent protein translocase protein TatA
MAAAAADMKKAVHNLNEIIGQFRKKLHTPQEDLPTLNKEDLSESIKQTLETLQRLTDDYTDEENEKDDRNLKGVMGVIRTIGDAIKSICQKSAPFVKAAVSIINKLAVVMIKELKR